MGKKLAIIGHPTRGNEVIKLLEMMGGKNCYNLSGLFTDYGYYFIGGARNDEIRGEEYIFGNEDICLFTLEEFLEKYPFKIHDFVHIPEYESEVGICGMRWDSLSKCVEYMVYRNDDEEWYTAEELLNWNDNPNETTEDGKYYAVRKKPKYPTTYGECWKVRFEVDGETTLEEFHHVSGYYSESLGALQKLLCCRDAYWKIYGEEMGLDEPWKPDWSDVKQSKFGIHTVENQIKCITLHVLKNLILVFPTIEMRDAFYENFKDLIEQCKELL